MRSYLFCLLASFSLSAQALQVGDVFLDPHVAVGYNVAQGTYVLLGADLGYTLTDQVSIGVGGYYSAGKHPEDDREIGGGPFVSFAQPIVSSILVAQIREDLDYVDERNPVVDGTGNTVGYVGLTGMESVTSFGLHLKLGRAFGISGGYRAVLALSNSDLGKDRSGTFLGFSIGF